MAKSNPQGTYEQHTAIDPLVWLNSQFPTSIDGSCVTQRCLDLHRAKYNDLDKAQRTVFGGTIAQLKARLSDRLNVSPEEEGASQWQKQLTRAVELGQPAKFSTNNENEQCIKVYAVEKLQPRCRQLHHLIFHDNLFCAKIRSKLLPSATDNSLTTTNCISLGGGPGFDHITFCIAAKFLHDIQPTQRNALLPNRIKTQVYDLYNDDWEPVMESLGECFDDQEHLTMHHVDLRLDLADEAHAQLRSSLQSVDIICAQFVLHENTSFISKEVDIEVEGAHQKRIVGVMRDILAMAPVSTIMIITDSANTLFPCLKDAANENGWRYLCAEEQLREEGKRRAYLGPKSFLILERVSINIL